MNAKVPKADVDDLEGFRRSRCQGHLRGEADRAFVATLEFRKVGRAPARGDQDAGMTWHAQTCDDCGGHTSGGPMLRDELWASIAKPRVVRVEPVEPDLFSWADVPCFRDAETFLCHACIERRLGRRLFQDDLNTSAWNVGWMLPRRCGHD